jgi:hypothetical protein
MRDNRGRSMLGLCHPKFNVAAAIKGFDNATEIRAGWLDLFFNAKDSNNAIKLMQQPKKKFIRIHVINGSGMNNNRTCPHEITYRETTATLCAKIQKNDAVFMGKFRKRLAVLRGIVNQAPAGTLDLAISPWLEHLPIPADVFNKLAAEVSAVFPEAKIVDNPRDVSTPFIAGPYFHERHGDVPDPKNLDLVDLDGSDFESVDVIKYMHRFANCRAVYLWGLGENGNWGTSNWLPPEKRVGWTSDREQPIYNYFLKQEADTVNSPVNPVDLVGVKTNLNPHDGWKREFVWKIAEWKKTVTIVFPRKFRSRFKAVEIRKDGRVIDKPTFRAILNDGTGRLIYDCRRRPTDFTDNSILVADGNGWALDKPQFRID